MLSNNKMVPDMEVTLPIVSFINVNMLNVLDINMILAFVTL